ncbi:hypothetical protein KPL76_07760 [Subtercola sp. PAMC28395]|uniref:hypothetical protein n=1 Tax=Subtercola sp. PAMC28395 TaxID=2846775 RepID=UPI001C0D7BDA|nr:hypothetical protein [Subtercola sp. PAMC28395]QWT22710.1 hypothetical protein KPL76_07760 [Subtercola sp. PAMC28395]
MSTYRLTVNNERYFLPEGRDVVGLKAVFAEASRMGGGFVDVLNTSKLRVALLITPSSSIKFEEFDAVLQIDELWQPPLAHSSAQPFALSNTGEAELGSDLFEYDDFQF